MPKIPFDVDKNFGKPSKSAKAAIKGRKTSPILLALSVAAFGYAVLRIVGYV